MPAGKPSIIAPIAYSVSYNKDIIILMGATLLLILFPFTGKKDEMTRSNGIVYLIIYMFYQKITISKCLYM